jgi:hypothetical protein
LDPSRPFRALKARSGLFFCSWLLLLTMTLIDVFCSDKVARSVLLILILAAFAVFIVNIHPFADDHKWKLSVRIYLVTVASMSEILDLVLYFNGRDPTIKGGVTPCASDFARTQQLPPIRGMMLHARRTQPVAPIYLAGSMPGAVAGLSHVVFVFCMGLFLALPLAFFVTNYAPTLKHLKAHKNRKAIIRDMLHRGGSQEMTGLRGKDANGGIKDAVVESLKEGTRVLHAARGPGVPSFESAVN